MRKLAMVIMCIVVRTGVEAQSTDVAGLLTRLDSIRHSSSPARHFATVYFYTTLNAIGFFEKYDEPTRRLMDRMETRFASYFFASYDSFEACKPVSPIWKQYYSDTSFTGTRYLLYGINAHINGDIWQALTTEFTAGELKQLKPHYHRYRKGLAVIYDAVYKDVVMANPKNKLLHKISFGVDRWYGRQVLNRWRKRQWLLAEHYFNDPGSFKQLLQKIQLKREKIDKLISRHTK